MSAFAKTLWHLVCALCVSAPGDAEATLGISLLDNGDFEELARLPGGGPVQPVPWWRTAKGDAQIEGESGARRLRTAPGEWTRQPVAAYAPLMAGLTVTGRIDGEGVVHVMDGEGRASFPVAAGLDPGRNFRITGREIEAALGRPAMPRLVIELAPGEGGQTAYWSDLEVMVELPLPTEDELRAEIIEHLTWIFDLWLERGLDTVGPRDTAFMCRFHDVITGERLAPGPAAYHPFYRMLMRALDVEEVPRWREALDAYARDLIVLGLHPATGLPCLWDPVADERIEVGQYEGSAALGFLIDLALREDGAWSESAREAARSIGEHVLARGVLPDGNVAYAYRPFDGRPHDQLPALRRLDYPAQLARLGALTGDERFTDAARDAIYTLEYTHIWLGDWMAIDPGFDDNYGHYGARAVTMWEAHPTDATFARLATGGLDYYGPRWRDALRLGGNVAADQVRCWEIARDIAHLDPERVAPVSALLADAVRVHFKGEQYQNGAWGDVTIFAFDPKSNLQVGELPGVPQNLLAGLASAYDPALDLSRDELRAMFTTVMRTTVETYRRPYGYLRGRGGSEGVNPSGGSLRFAVGLVEMLRWL